MFDWWREVVVCFIIILSLSYVEYTHHEQARTASLLWWLELEHSIQTHSKINPKVPALRLTLTQTSVT